MAILTNILAVIPSVKFIQSVFPSLVETAVTKKLLSVKCWKEKDWLKNQAKIRTPTKLKKVQ